MANSTGTEAAVSAKLPLICDPSHIAGLRSLIGSISQKALDLDYNGLIIEVHPNPDKALSDAKQQITPDTLMEIRENLHVRRASSDDAEFQSHLEELRSKINIIDHDIIDASCSPKKSGRRNRPVQKGK